MQKIVINRCIGGFGLSKEALDLYNELAGTDYDWYGQIKSRDCPHLVQVVEQLGSDKASDSYAKLKVVEVPDDIEWVIMDYDGSEWVAEKHRTWR